IVIKEPEVQLNVGNILKKPTLSYEVVIHSEKTLVEISPLLEKQIRDSIKQDHDSFKKEVIRFVTACEQEAVAAQRDPAKIKALADEIHQYNRDVDKDCKKLGKDLKALVHEYQEKSQKISKMKLAKEALKQAANKLIGVDVVATVETCKKLLFAAKGKAGSMI